MEPAADARESLKSLLAKAPRLAPARAARICARVLGVLEARPSLHGRLGPEVVLVGDGDEVSLLERAGEAPPEYQAPEQALGEAIDGRADVYAAGVMLYEMLSGRRPFEGKTKGELISALLVRDPAPLREVPEELAAVVGKALAKKVGERWQTAAEMRAALEAETAAGDDAGPPPSPAAELPRERASTLTLAPAVKADDAFTPAIRTCFPTGASTPTAAPAPTPRPAGLRGDNRLSLLVGSMLLLSMLAVFLLRPKRGGDAPAEGRAPPALMARLRATMERGELAAARLQGEELARGYPRDARAFALLGDVLFAQGDKERALAAYREAHHLEPAVGALPEVLANLRATFSDPEHGEAAFRLAEAIGAPAEPILSDLAAHTGEARLKRRAAEAIGRITRAERSP